MTEEIRVEQADVVPAVDLLSLYTAVQWEAYVGEPDQLVRAVDNSDFVATAVFENADGDQEVIGLVRVLTDSVSVAFIQDLLVHPDHQRNGIGTKLMQLVLSRYDGVRRFVLLTDDEPELRLFYASLGFARGGDEAGPAAGLLSFVR